MFLGPDGRPVPKVSAATALAVATPGTVRGYAEAHRRLGRLPWAKVVASAERLAREGFFVPAGLAEDIAESRQRLTRWDEDLAGYAPVWRAPDEIRLGRFVIHTMPLPSSARLAAHGRRRPARIRRSGSA
jgi:gamma-glutamyltranspeptidase